MDDDSIITIVIIIIIIVYHLYTSISVHDELHRRKTDKFLSPKESAV